MKKLYLHIGIEKTGTSATQEFLFSNRDRLLEKGFLYPETGIWHDKSHHGIAFSWTQNSLWDKSILSSQEITQKIMDEFDNSGVDNLIISSEILRKFYESKGFPEIKEWIKSNFGSVELIVYLRDQIGWLSSMYNQFVKDPNTKYYKDIEDFVEEFRNAADFNSLLVSWESSLSGIKFNINVLPYLPKQYCVIEQFLEVLNLEKKFFMDDKNNAVNPSLTRPAFDLIRNFNRYELDLDTRKKLNRKIIDFYRAGGQSAINGELSIISKALSERIVDRYKLANEKVYKKYKLPPNSLDIFESKKKYKLYNGLTIQALDRFILALIKEI